MELPGKETTPTQWIMWVAGTLLLYVLGHFTWPARTEEVGATPPLHVTIERLDRIIKSQEDMRREHSGLLIQAMIQCYNHAENVQQEQRRHQQMRRCITQQLNPEQ